MYLTIQWWKKAVVYGWTMNQKLSVISFIYEVQMLEVYSKNKTVQWIIVTELLEKFVC